MAGYYECVQERRSLVETGLKLDSGESVGVYGDFRVTARKRI